MRPSTLEITLPGATGYIQARNTGGNGIFMQFHGGTIIRLRPGESAPIMGGALDGVTIKVFCVGSPDSYRCARADCDEPCCTWCGKHLSEHQQ